MFAGGAVLVAGLTPPESPDSGEACARCPLCFYSGKVVLTGGKSIKDIEKGWNILWYMVQRFIE